MHDEDFDDPFPDPVEIEITDVFDLHTIPPREVKLVVEEYLRLAREHGFKCVRIIHGKGIGVQREMVRSILGRTPFVSHWNGDPGASQGGGILAAAPLIVQNAIISGNHASVGGGIANVLGSQVTVEMSTISGNQSGSAGGIHSSGGLSLLNVTVSGNSAPDFWGGGMDLYGTNTLRNVTVANNTSPIGGGIMVSSGSQTLTHVIIANNSPSNCYFNKYNRS